MEVAIEPTGIGTCRKQNASVALLGEILLDDQKIIGVIEDQQPSLLAMLQPTFDRWHELALVRLAFCCKGGKQFCKGHKTGDQSPLRLQH